jgi:thermitase
MIRQSIRFTSFILASGSLLVSLSACQQGITPAVSGQRAASLGALSTATPQVNRTPFKASLHANTASVPGEIIVRFKAGVSASSTQTALSALRLSTVQTVGQPSLGIQVVKTPAGISETQAIEALRRNPAVLYAEPNGIISLSPEQASALAQTREGDAPGYPNDEMFEKQYAHKLTSSQAGWAIQKGNADMVLAIVDTGVDLKHPDLAAKLIKGYDFVDKDEDPNDGQGHGTHCAGISAALTDNKIGVAGYAPGVKVMPVRVLDNRGSGTWADVAAGIAYAADNGAKVISLSLGGGSDSAVVGDAVRHALSKDAVVVAAMGNSGREQKSYPAAYPGVVAVGATDSSDARASFSQYGPWISVSAPGVNILSTFPTYASGMPSKDYGSISGTSMATPAVAGLAALVRSQFPALTQEQVKAHLEATSDDRGDAGFDKYYGHGRVNVAKALSTAPGRR